MKYLWKIKIAATIDIAAFYTGTVAQNNWINYAPKVKTTIFTKGIHTPVYRDGISHCNGNTNKLVTNQRNFTNWHGTSIAEDLTSVDSIGVPFFKNVWIRTCSPKYLTI